MENFLAVFTAVCLVGIVAVPSLSQQAPDLASPEVRELVNISGHWYYISQISVTIAEAVTVCNDLGMKLVSIQTAEKQQAIAEYLDNNGHETAKMWTSGIRLSGNIFLWSGTGEMFNYTNWRSDQPNNTDECYDVCVYTSDNETERQWLDKPCTDEVQFICEEMSVACKQ